MGEQFANVGKGPSNRYYDAVIDSDITLGTVFNYVGGGATFRLGFNLTDDLSTPFHKFVHVCLMRQSSVTSGGRVWRATGPSRAA